MNTSLLSLLWAGSTISICLFNYASSCWRRYKAIRNRLLHKVISLIILNCAVHNAVKMLIIGLKPAVTQYKWRKVQMFVAPLDSWYQDCKHNIIKRRMQKPCHSTWLDIDWSSMIWAPLLIRSYTRKAIKMIAIHKIILVCLCCY